MAESNDESRVVWFCAGVAVGATIALLFAPQSGEETRTLIKSTANKGRDRLADKGRELADRGRDLYDKGRSIADEAADMFERGKRMVDG
ncbi:MAG: YtxH domain-containing protein [Bryobacteraceae bacterium]